MLKCAKLVQNYAQGPHIAFGRVGLALACLRTHIVGRAHHCLRRRVGILQHARDTKITEFNGEVTSQKYVLSFQIPMNDSAGMHVLKSQAYLDEPVENVCFLKKLFILYFSLDVVAEVAHLAVLHYNNEHLEREVALLVGHDVGVVEVFEQIHFKHGGLLLFLFQARKHYFLGYVIHIFLLVPH